MAERFRILLGAALCAATLDAQAVAIGPIRGEAVVGQPLELNVDVTLDAGSDPAAACVAAELFYGDSRVDPARVRVTSRPGSQPLHAQVQVATAMAVNEPVVSIQLRAGCAAPVSRRFVLLSSSPVESTTVVTAPVAPPAGARALPLASDTTLPVGRGTPTAAGQADGGSAAAGARNRAAGGSAAGPAAIPRSPAADSAGASAASAARQRRQAEAREAREARAAQMPPIAGAQRQPAAPKGPPAAEPAPRSNGPRLELQSPSEWLQEQQLPLRASDDMAPPSLTTTAEQRATAAALWRALNAEVDAGAAGADPEAQVRVQALEAQVKTLQNAARIARGRETDLQAQLGQAQQERETFWMAIWAFLGLVVAAVLVAVLLVWRRGGRGSPLAWWKSRRKSAFDAEAATVFADGFMDTQPAPPDFVYPEDPAQMPRPFSETVQADDPAYAATIAAARPKPAAAQDPDADADAGALAPTSAEAALRAARELRKGSTDELADVQQNADFFASLGQYDQAIELLQDYIAQHPGTSPVAYLDLLKLFHTLSQTEPYRQLRHDFNAVFNAEVPVFAAFLRPSRELMDYPEVLQRISQTWQRPQVLDLLESMLVRQPAEDGHPPFELEAFHDLLLLYEIAKLEHGAQAGTLLPPASTHTGSPGGGAAAAAASAGAAAGAGTAGPDQAEGGGAALAAGATMAAGGAALGGLAAGSQAAHVAADFDPHVPLDFPLEPEQPAEDFGSLGLALDLPAPAGPAPAPHPLLDDIALSSTEPAGTDTASASSDPHLIDFDMFDIALPPASKPKD